MENPTSDVVPAETSAPEPEPTLESNAERKPFPLWAKIVIPIGVIALAGVIALTIHGLTPSHQFADALDECGLADSAGVHLGDNGQTLALDQKGDEDESGLAIPELACVFYSLKMPDSIIEQMESTRALDGAQSADWDGIKVTWRYHPDNGLDSVLTTK